MRLNLESKRPLCVVYDSEGSVYAVPHLKYVYTTSCFD